MVRGIPLYPCVCLLIEGLLPDHVGVEATVLDSLAILFPGLLLVLVVVLLRSATWSRRRLGHLVVRGLLALDGLIALVALAAAGLVWLGAPPSVLAAPPVQEGGEALSGTVAIGAALATGLAAIGAGIAVGIAGAAAIGTIAEKPETLGRTLIFVGLAEGIAIYGLIISFMILTR